MLKSFISCIVIVFAGLVAASLLDIFLYAIHPRFYSRALFIVTFGVAGVFASVVGYMTGVENAKVKKQTARWYMISLLIGIGLLFFFFIAKAEGGEYEPAFKSYGVMMVVGTFLFIKEKIE